MKYSTDIVAFLVELYQRMSLKSPKFFQVLQGIGMACALISGIPLLLQQIEGFTGQAIHLPEVVNGMLIRIVFWCGLVVKIMAKLPVHQPPVEDGQPVSKVEALPYTAKKAEVPMETLIGKNDYQQPA